MKPKQKQRVRCLGVRVHGSVPLAWRREKFEDHVSQNDRTPMAK
jgi:hypothetical protein